MGHNVAALVRLMLVTDDDLMAQRDPVALALAAERGGASSVQLRLKRASARQLAALAPRLVGALRIPLLVNDRPDIALATGAAGVHLGPEDVPVGLVRAIAPAGFVIGASVGSEAEAEAAGAADYWGIGPWRVSGTKRDAGTGLGAEGFRRLLALAGGRPCLAIGGIRPEDVSEVVAAGGQGVAVVSGILGGSDVERATASYARALS
ncbi:MAG: thiamine phosphate synthase [Gemmatimonadales bacterium]